MPTSLEDCDCNKIDLQLRCDLEVAVGGPRRSQVVCQIVSHRRDAVALEPDVG
jgi:hypothetical protein